MENYDFVVVGAGLAGGVIARKLAEEKGKKILIIERRNHVAGNTFDYEESQGIRVQKYGPHVLHTNNEEVYKFITRFCTPLSYRTKCEAVIDGISTPSPFNFKTIDQFYEVNEAKELKAKLLRNYNNRESVTVVEMMESEDAQIKGFARFLFDKDYKPYTSKQWNLDPSEIDPSVLKRVPIVLSYSDTYFYDRYEFIPKEGFVELYKNIINHPNIKVELNKDALDHIMIDDKNKRIIYDNNNKIDVIYTGAIDELFNYKYGVLPYRSLYFVFKTLEMNSFQNVSIVAYPQEDSYTRVTEYTKMPIQDCNGWTCIAFEYPIPYKRNSKKGCERYYPVLTESSIEMYSKYETYASKFRNLILCGRLAEFKYFNMDQVIMRSLEIYNSLEV